MLSYWSAPAGALAVLACLRLARLDWTAGIAAAFVVLPLAHLAAAGCAAGALIARRRPTRATAAGAGRIAIGVAEDRRVVSIPLPADSGSHTLIVGATGSGKTVTETLILVRAIERGY